ncbi:MAG: long-chain acyl-CoA synthetase, partial [Tardiphaga sp.]|nr:long-chain acyl-CoA synthetase [Tardiphaga sp.]
KDLIIRGGHNIDPAMIEDIAMQFPGVSLAAAVGRPDSYSGEVPMLFVSATPGASIDAAALAAFMNERVADSTARPKAIEIVGEIPLTPVGKIFKPRLREIAAEQAVRQVLSAHAASSAFTAQAITDPDRGLFVRVTFEGDAAAATKVTRELGLLPVATQIVGPT